MYKLQMLMKNNIKKNICKSKKNKKQKYLIDMKENLKNSIF